MAARVALLAAFVAVSDAFAPTSPSWLRSSTVAKAAASAKTLIKEKAMVRDLYELKLNQREKM